jgi:hypothetical protein
MVSPFRGDGPFRGRGPFLGRGPWAGRGPGGFNVGIPFAIDATGTQIRAAISDPTAYASGGYLLRGLGGARLNAAARSSVAMQQKADGTYEYAAHNLLTFSEQFDDAAWLKIGATVTANTGATPGGSTTAESFIEDTSTGTHTLYRGGGTGIDKTVVTTFSIYVKAVNRTRARLRMNFYGSNVVTATYQLANGSVTTAVAGTGVLANANIVSVGGGWFRCSVAGSSTTAGTGFDLDFFAVNDAGSTSYTGSGLTSFELWGAQLNLGPTALPYVPTTTAAVYAPAVDWLSAQSAYGLRSEAAATNRALWARDLTNAAWTKTNATAALTATGIDGVANSASVVTATAGNATVLQAITHASEARTLSIFLKRRTGAGTVETTIDGGSTWVARTLTTDWQRFTTTSTLADPSVGIRIVTSGDAVDVDAVQVETGSRASSPILTLGATATRAADTPAVPLGSWFNATEGTLAANFVKATNAVAGRVITIDDGTGNNQIRINGSLSTNVRPDWQVVTGGVSQANVLGAAEVVAGALGKAAGVYKLDDFQGAVNNVLGTADTAGTVPTVTTMRLGTNEAGTANLNGYFTRIRYIGRRLSDGQLRALTV